MGKRIIYFLIITACIASCKNEKTSESSETVEAPNSFEQTIERLKASETSRDSLLLSNYESALENYQSDPNAINTIWLGRRIAYTGEYNEAIQIYTKGIAMFPQDARLFRHRGHRFISTRQFDNAINDLEHAAGLIKGTEDVIEPDGIPNRLNRPVSSLHTNIWYHLGLAYYLKNDLSRALNAFQYCLNASKNDDMLVATTHWLYMIQRRLNNDDAALGLLEPISPTMNIIENDGYHQLLLFYKGELTEDSLKGNGSSGASEAVKYGIANWHHYNEDVGKARMLYQELVDTGNPAGFGFIAAEADLKRF